MLDAATILDHLDRRRTRGRSAVRRHLSLSIGVGILVVVIALAVAAPWISGYDPSHIDPLHPLAPPFSPGHLFGTDDYGRDILARILYGARIDLMIAFGATGVTFVVGSLIGLISGYFGGWVDNVIMRIVDLFFAFPFFVLVIAIIAMLGPSVFNMFVAIWLTSWISYARIARSHTLVAKQQEYVLAARTLGFGPLRIITRHIMPNVIAYSVIYAMVDAVGNILLGAALGFFGLGARPPSPEWGAMIAAGQNFMLSAWWLPTIPGLAIVVVGVAFSLVGDGLAEILTPGD